MTNGCDAETLPMGKMEDAKDPIGPVGRFGSGFGYCSQIRWVLEPIGVSENYSLVAKRTMDSVTTFQLLLRAFWGINITSDDGSRPGDKRFGKRSS